MVDIVTPNFVTAFATLFELQCRRNYAQPTLKGHVIRAWRPDSYVSCVPKKWTKISLQFPFIQYLASSVLIRFMAAGLFIYVDGFDCKLVNYYLQSCYVRQKTTTLWRKQRQIFNKLKTTKKRFQGSVGRQSTLWSPRCSSTSGKIRHIVYLHFVDGVTLGTHDWICSDIMWFDWQELFKTLLLL